MRKLRLRLPIWLAPRAFAALGAIALLYALAPGVALFAPLATLLLVVLLALIVIDASIGPARRSLHVTRDVPEHFSLRVDATITYRVENRSNLPVRVGIYESALRTLRDDHRASRATIPAQARADIARTLLPVARGLDRFGTLYLWYENALGLTRRRMRVEATHEFRVYPDLRAVERYGSLRARNRLIEAGLRRMRMRGIGTEFESLREYGSGDAFRSIDWKATARRGKVMVTQREVERSQDVMVLIDCGRLMTPRIDEQRKLDYAITSALSVASIAALASDRVGVLAFASSVLLARAPRSTTASIRALSDALVDVEPVFEESDYAHAFSYVRTHLKRRSLIVFFTDVIDPVAQSAVLAELASLARRHVVLCVFMNDAAVREALRAVPASVDDAYVRDVAVGLDDERRRARATLEALGVHVLDVPAKELSVSAIDAYLRIKQRALI